MIQSIMRIFGEVVKEFRKDNKLTQEQLAKIAKTRQGRIAAIERCKHQPRLSTLRRFAKVLGVQFSINVGAGTEVISLDLEPKKNGNGRKGTAA